jgi:DNA-binding phage protein
MAKRTKLKTRRWDWAERLKTDEDISAYLTPASKKVA